VQLIFLIYSLMMLACLPMMIARLWSCNAPETISEAEAEPSLIKTTIGAPFNTSPGSALNLMLLFLSR
jgi:hypothetical protein